jgi:flagellar P-ring protein precursor FlgI
MAVMQLSRFRARYEAIRFGYFSTLLLFPILASHAFAQSVRIRDLTVLDGATPVRIVGYGIVVGLDGTGDRGISGRSGDQTVRSIANLLRRFDIQIPAEALRTRNSAAVLVTAEISPYLRPGGRFDVTVSSLGDARSLRGGTLWMTPLVTDAGADPIATAQGSIVISEGKSTSRDAYAVETSGRIPSGGVLEGELPRTNFSTTSRLLLKEPNIATATKIAEAINQGIAPNTAIVEDPGAIALTLPDAATRSATLVKIQDLAITPDRPNRIIIDSRDGTVVAGGDITVSGATVSHGGVTLTIGSAADATPARPRRQQRAAQREDADETENFEDPARPSAAVTLQPGVSAQKIASALHAVQLTPQEIAAIFESLRSVGALSAEVIVK